MSEDIIIALLGVASSMLLVNWRLKKLEEKVDKHNAWGEKFQVQATAIEVIKTDIGYIKNAIEKLERGN